MAALPHALDARPLIAGAQVLTLVGMAGVYLVPRRVCVIVRDFVFDRTRMPLVAAWLLMLATLAPALVAAVLGADAVPLTLRCLAGAGCGGSSVGGLLAMFPFGLAVIVMEIAGAAAGLIRRNWHVRPAA